MSNQRIQDEDLMHPGYFRRKESLVELFNTIESLFGWHLERLSVPEQDRWGLVYQIREARDLALAGLFAEENEWIEYEGLEEEDWILYRRIEAKEEEEEELER